MAAERVDFYYSIGSRYSYLASTQIAKLEGEAGCRVRWHPVNGPDIGKLRGRDPFAGEPLSGQYEWPYRRYDAECWADYYGVPFREPANPHFDYRLLVKAATAAKRLGAVVPYSHALFRAVWVEGVWPLDEEVCRQAAVSVGLSSGEFSEAFADPATEDELRNAAAEAASERAPPGARSRGAPAPAPSRGGGLRPRRTRAGGSSRCRAPARA